MILGSLGTMNNSNSNCEVLLSALDAKLSNGEGGIPGSAPLASLRSCHPNDAGKFFSHTLLGFESRILTGAASTERAGFASRPTCGVSNPRSDAAHRACSHPA